MNVLNTNTFNVKEYAIPCIYHYLNKISRIDFEIHALIKTECIFDALVLKPKLKTDHSIKKHLTSCSPLKGAPHEFPAGLDIL